MNPVIIVGSGFAGYTLAREFRKLDTTTPLVIITSDDGRSYPKPMLSNALSKGKTADQLAMFTADAMATTLNATILNNCIVNEIDPQQKTITTSDSQVIYYENLVLALGANPIRSPIDGDASDDVLSINNLADYTKYRERLLKAKHVAIIGPGLIGCEFANDLITVDTSVSIIGPSSLPMNSLLPEPIAQELKSTLENAGVNWHLNTTASTINHSQDDATEGYDINLSNGESIHADIVVSAIGLRSNIALAQSIGLAVNRGIVTNKHLQTSHSNIYALGDCAEVAGHNLLFIAPILAAAKALAKTLAGDLTAVSYPAMPVAVKTPNYPLIVAPPATDAIGAWQFEPASSGFGIKGIFTNDSGAILGFVLSGDTVSEKQALSKELPHLLS